ncbi:MAG: hypothetical protein LQ351_003753 [Letrouitia transgressa]|nr:MAG: hypothetical protein LQ351_003753 [Letrouitia transgressa]
MGQSSSTSRRQHEGFQDQDAWRSSRNAHEGGLHDSVEQGLDQSQTLINTAGQGQEAYGSRHLQSFATFSRQISAQSIPVRSGGSSSGGYHEARDQIFYEQQEERPLVHMEELGMRNAPITHITASPMPRRHSTLSRLSSRVLPRHSTSGVADIHDAPRIRHRSLRQRLSNYVPSSLIQERRPSSRRPFIPNFSFPSTGTTSRLRHRGDLAPVSRPLPLVFNEEDSMSDLASPSLSTTPTALSLMPTQQSVPLPRTQSDTRSSRLSRIRRSLTDSFETFLPTLRHGTPDVPNHPNPTLRPLRAASTDDTNHWLPPQPTTNASLDLGGVSLGPSLYALREPPTQGHPVSAEASDGLSSRSEGASWSERRPVHGAVGRRESRRMPNMLRGRSSRLVRRQDEGPLPRILHLAAVAIAAQLSENPAQAINNLQAIGSDGLDESMADFFRTLQDAPNARPDDLLNEANNPTRAIGAWPPLNFVRVFRFINSSEENGVHNGTSNTERSPSGRQGEDQVPRDTNSLFVDDTRTATLVVVGVRSVPSEHVGHENVANAGPNLDALFDLPLAAPNALSSLRRRGTGGFLRHTDGDVRFSDRRPNSMGDITSLPANSIRQRHRQPSSPVEQSLRSTALATTGVPLALSELASGPFPPPSSPADSALSPFSSGSTTPIRRPSSASALHHPRSPSIHSVSNRQHEASFPTLEDQEVRPGQPRRRSDSEFARHRELGAGAARRNGVVEPVGVEAEEPPSLGSRSWLIYVVGTNLAGDHPALTTPSLFTDNPTYEDMLMLSSLLGPAKPPVASREDVASIHGVYNLEHQTGNLVAISLLNGTRIDLAAGERCLVCLSDYNLGDQVRQLQKCSHWFHRECIDQHTVPFDVILCQHDMERFMKTKVEGQESEGAIQPQ